MKLLPLCKSSVTIAVLGLCLSAISAPADELDPRIEKLLVMPSRPTVTEIFEIYGKVGRTNPMSAGSYGYTGRDPYTSFDDRFVVETMPRFIAAFERVYPGATYGGLGRDSARVVDILDAFYLQIGQPGRAIRLNASGNSLRASTSGELVKFLESNGASLNPKNTKFTPLVIFDATSFNEDGGSQSTSLLQAALQKWKRNRGTAEGFLQRINVIATQIYEENPIDADLDVAAVFVRQAEQLEESKLSSHQTETFSFIEAQVINYGGNFWHETFPSLALNKFTGKYEGVVPQTDPVRYRAQRIQVLGHIFDAIRLTRSKKFLDNVRAETAALGFRFNEKGGARPPVVKRPSPEELAKIGEANFKRYLRSSLGEIKQMQAGEKSGYVGTIGKAYVDLITQAPNVSYYSGDAKQAQRRAALEVLAQLEKEWKGERIGNRELRRLGAIAMAYIGEADETAAAAIQRILGRSPELRGALQERWLTLTDPDSERRLSKASGLSVQDVANAYQAWIRQGLLEVDADCRDVLLNGAARPAKPEPEAEAAA